MPKLIITRGLPGSGKSTRAKAWVAEDPSRRARVNRDDLGSMLHGFRAHKGETEQQITKVRDAVIASLLKRGIDVVSDDMNLPQRYARDLLRLAVQHGAEFEVWDLTDVPLETCVERDELRHGTLAFIGADVITTLHARFLRGRKYPLPYPEEPTKDDAGLTVYLPDDTLPHAIMVDLDGTVALMVGRSPFDWSRVMEDRPNRPVIDAVRLFAAAGHQVIFLSGRQAVCYEETRKWIDEHVNVPYVGLYMRPTGDMRQDSIVKRELFDEHVRPHFNVKAAFDDRTQVVEMWRKLGIPVVFQVAEGNF